MHTSQKYITNFNTFNSGLLINGAWLESEISLPPGSALKAISMGKKIFWLLSLTQP